MGLNLSQLENVKYQGKKVISRCPACGEMGNDRKGNHLFIEPGGRFGCVVYPGTDGHQHRQRIFELIGMKSSGKTGFAIRKPMELLSKGKVIQKDILGHLGRFQMTPARKEANNNQDKNINQKEPKTSVPPVPKESLHLYSPSELEMLDGIDVESLKQIDEIKHMFNGTVARVADPKPY